MVSPSARRLLSAALATVACACERTTTPTFVVRDSAGVRIVESSAPVWAEEDEWIVRAVNVAPYDLLHLAHRQTTMERYWEQFRSGDA